VFRIQAPKILGRWSLFEGSMSKQMKIHYEDSVNSDW